MLHRCHTRETTHRPAEAFTPLERLRDIPPGSLFRTFADGVLAVKSKYTSTRNKNGAWQCDCTLLAGGAVAHFADGGNELVSVVLIGLPVVVSLEDEDEG